MSRHAAKALARGVLAIERTFHGLGSKTAGALSGRLPLSGVEYRCGKAAMHRDYSHVTDFTLYARAFENEI